jgi:hypothetical protein
MCEVFDDVCEGLIIIEAVLWVEFLSVAVCFGEIASAEESGGEGEESEIDDS